MDPLKPGTQLVFAGTTVDDNGKRKPHRIVITVTDLVKKINGIDVAVIWERDIADGKLEESELIFFFKTMTVMSGISANTENCTRVSIWSADKLGWSAI